MRAVIVAIAAIALSGCTTLQTYWHEASPAKRVALIGLIGFSVYTGRGVFFGSPSGNRQCVSGTPIDCPPDPTAPPGATAPPLGTCTCL